MAFSAKSLLRSVGVDRPVFYSSVGQAWSLFSGPVTALMVITFLTGELQGYYYTFGSVTALQVFLELGFSYCITQFASHEAARLEFGPDGSISGDSRARSRLIALGKLALKWHAVLAVLAFVLVGVCGHVFFSLKHDSGSEWVGPWWLVCFAAAIVLLIQPVGALIEGCNQVSFIYGLRTITRIVVAVSLWATLFAGFGLYAAAVTALVGAIVATIGYARKWPTFLKLILREPTTESISWKKEIWPFQWRIAVSWGCGYFVFSFFNPVVFWFEGKVAAGQMGQSLGLITSVGALAGAWIGAKGPRFGVLVKNRQFEDLNREFKVATTQAVFMCVAAGLALLGGLWGLQNYLPHLAPRFLGIEATAFLVVAAVCNQIITGQAAYLRAFKREPFMVLSIVSGILNGVGLLVCAYFWGTLGACVSYAASQFACTFLATWIWRKRSAEWQNDPPE